METLWVLDAVYGVERDAIARALEMLLQHAQLVLQDEDAVLDALGEFRNKPVLGFSDGAVVDKG
ncbi:MAG: hypothetical protein QM601_00815 [Pseudoxanthomonas sp.]